MGRTRLQEPAVVPDVIVMDYVMPTMDGIEATHSHSRDEEDNSAKHAVL